MLQTRSSVMAIGPVQRCEIGAPAAAGKQAPSRRSRAAKARARKLILFKMKRRKGYRRKQGHRQPYTEIRVDRIEG